MLELNEERVALHNETLYYIHEARRAIGHALLDLMEKNRRGYVEWMENATWLLTEAVKRREYAHQEPWRK